MLYDVEEEIFRKKNIKIKLSVVIDRGIIKMI
jgi:hypothetical protein